MRVGGREAREDPVGRLGGARVGAPRVEGLRDDAAALVGADVLAPFGPDVADIPEGFLVAAGGFVGGGIGFGGSGGAFLAATFPPASLAGGAFGAGTGAFPADAGTLPAFVEDAMGGAVDFTGGGAVVRVGVDNLVPDVVGIDVDVFAEDPGVAPAVEEIEAVGRGDAVPVEPGVDPNGVLSDRTSSFLGCLGLTGSVVTRRSIFLGAFFGASGSSLPFFRSAMLLVLARVPGCRTSMRYDLSLFEA